MPLFIGTIWKLDFSKQTTLNLTPEIPANWGPRYFLYAEFSNIHTGRKIIIFNYHGFVGGPHQPDFDVIKTQLNQAGDTPLIFMGDFNPTVTDYKSTFHVKHSKTAVGAF